MTCSHLRQLFELCQTEDLKVSSSDVIKFVCNQCEEIEVCPSMLSDEYNARNPDLQDTTQEANSLPAKPAE